MYHYSNIIRSEPIKQEISKVNLIQNSKPISKPISKQPAKN